MGTVLEGKMKQARAPGTSHKRSIIVGKARTIDFMGEDLRVYATPEMVRDIEITCRELLLPFCEPGEDSAGTRVEADHLAPALLGSAVDITVTVAEVKGRLITFEASVRDAIDDIGRGRHTRFVGAVAKTKQRFEGKAAKIASAKPRG
jgi:fluoroacetyl-CoA thioesterase